MATKGRSKDVICLFDVDGTLTKPRNSIAKSTKECLEKLKEEVYVGLVGGSDLGKIAEQMGGLETAKGLIFCSLRMDSSHSRTGH